MRTRIVVTAALAAAVFAAGPAAADSDGHATFGSQWWSQTAPEAKFQEFREVPRGAFLQSFLLHEYQAQGPWSASFWGANAIRKDQDAGLSVSRGVRFRVDATYLQTPHLLSMIARTPYTEVSPGVFRLPDTLQRVNQDYPASYNKTMGDLLGSAPGTALGIQTDVSSARLRVRPAKGWQFELSGSERQRSGHQAMAGTYGFSSSIELPVPVSQRMVDAAATGNYDGGPYRVQASVGLSDFHNNVGALIWDNPRRITDRTSGNSVGDGSVQGLTDLAPDNHVVRGNLALGVRLPRAATFSATLGLSRTEQDDAFLPFTINTAIAERSLDSLPARSLNGKMTQFTQDYRLTGEPVGRLFGTLRFHSDHLDNQTPEYTFIGQAIADQQWTAGAVSNKPFGNSNWVAGVDADADLTDWVGLSLLGERRRSEHTDREVDADNENVFGGSLKLHPDMDVSLSGGWTHRQRKLDHFEIAEYEDANGSLTEQAGLRRFDVADRNQDAATADLDWALGRRVDLSVQYQYTKNDYPNSVFGLQNTEQSVVEGEATLHLPRQFDVSGGYGFGQNITNQASNESNHTPPPDADAATNWSANLRDRNVYIFSRAQWWAMPKKLLLSADYSFSRAIGDFNLANAANTAVDVPGTLYRLHDLQVEARWRLRYDLDIAGRYGFEEYDVSDFAAQNIPLLGLTAGSATAIYLGDSYQGYKAHRVALLASRRF